MNARFALLLGALLCAAPAPAQTLDEAVDLYLQARYDESLPILDSLVRAHPLDADARVWLGENHYRLEQTDQALRAARQALRTDPCHSAAHNLVAVVYTRELWESWARDSTWAHVQRAVECDPGNGNAWLTYWISGAMRRDSAAQALAQRRIGELRFIPEAVMEQGRWLLRSAPPNAVLFTNGDWDFFPIMVAQSYEGLRPDVTVAMISMLEVPWYTRWLARHAGWPVPPAARAKGATDWYAADEDAGTLGVQAGALWARATLEGERPLTIPATATLDIVGEEAWARWDGPVFTLVPWEQVPADTTVVLDTDAFAASMRHLDLARLHGPVVHASDRSPIRRDAMHPAEFILYPVRQYVRQGLAAGRMEDARQGLAWADALVATGQASEESIADLQELRARAEAGGP